MRTRILMPVLVLAAFAAGCSSPLDVTPAGSIPDQTAIGDAPSARAALTGAYSALQSLSYYGEDFTLFGDLSADNATHSGTFQSFGDADQNQLHADNSVIAGIWSAIYDAINRTNQILQKVPSVPGLDDTERNEILGEAYFLRALHYHNLVKLFGGVPLVTEPATSLADAASVERASSDEVYQQILSDLDQAEQLITNTDQTRQASLGAVYALRARVLLYQQNWTGALGAADTVESMGYALASDFSDLFSADGSDTPEDIFRVIFTAQQFNNVGYYYDTKSDFGRYEQKPTTDLMQDFDPSFDPDTPGSYNPADARAQWTIQVDSKDRPFGAKFRASAGTEHLHVIRFAEVILTRAEALARLNRLSEAVDECNRVRVRAGLPPHVLGTDVVTQQDVIDAILNERRLELAFEGDRWPDLVRTGLATSVLGIGVNATLYPIPQRELDVSPNLTQNPGY